MTQTPSPPMEEITARGYQPPVNTQFSVFFDNRVGKLLELMEILEDRPLRLVALSVIDSADHAVVRILTTNAGLTRKLLREHHLAFTATDVLVVELGADHRLIPVCTCLLSAEVNIHYAYPLMVRPHGAPTIALHTDDEVLAGQILLRKHFTLLGEGDLEDSAGEGPGEEW